MLELALMEPKPIQDIAPPSRTTGPPAELRPEPEIIDDIPVQTPAGQVSNDEGPQPSKNDDSSFIVSATPLPAAINKVNQKPKIKDSKPKPTLAIVVALLAIILLVTGVYLKFFSNS